MEAPVCAFECRFGAACDEQDGTFPLSNDERLRTLCVNQGGTANVASPLCWGGAFFIFRATIW